MKHVRPAGLALLVAACLFQCGAASVILSGKPVTVPVAVPKTANTETMVLHIDGVRVNPRQSAILRIFAELPGANRSTSVADEHFIGHITLLARAGPVSRAGSNMVLNVPEHAWKWLQAKGAVRITIVPMNEAEVSIANVQLAPAKE